MNEKSHYLYARELAELYDISKQTLIFTIRLICSNRLLWAVMAIGCILLSSSLSWVLFLI